MLERLTVAQCAPVLRGLAEPARLHILGLLREGPLTVSEVSARLGMRPYQASRHLSALSDLHLLTRTREGRFVRYTLVDPKMDLGCCTLSVG